MTVITQPYKCEECPELKRPSNGWFIGLNIANMTLSVGVDFKITHAAIVCAWTDELAVNQGVAHLCGIDCALKWEAKQLAKLQSGYIAPRVSDGN